MPTPPDFTAGTALAAASLNKIGLWEIASKTWTSTTAGQQIDSCFTSSFTNYRVIVNATRVGTSPDNVYMRFVDGTTVDTGSVYGSNITTSNGVSGNANAWTGITNLLYVGYVADLTGFMVMDIANPQVSGQVTAINSFGSGFGNATQLVSTIYGLTTSTTQYEGLYLFPATGTWSGTATVYGYGKV
jgi:hypothetical protein